MGRFSIPTRSEVNADHQATFDNLNKALGFVPNLYAYYAKNDTALNDYLGFQNRKTTLSNKEKEVVNLVVSQFNGCDYCLAAHTAIAGMNGFSSEEIINIRKGDISFDNKLNALAVFSKEVVSTRGKVSDTAKDALFNAGYDEANLIDIVFMVGDKTISNYMHNITDFAIDFPAAAAI